MATRCLFTAPNCDFAVYKHWDWYPEHILPWVLEFNKDFNNNRKYNDWEYKLAQLLRDSVRNWEKYNLDPSEYTWWWIVPLEYDYNYKYHLWEKVEVKEHTLLAVYGTLKRWYYNHKLLENAHFILEDYIPATKVAGESFPKIFYNWEIKNYMVHCEIYCVPNEDMSNIDTLEWHPHWYKRTEVTTKNWYIVEFYNYISKLQDDTKNFCNIDENWKYIKW